MVYCLLLFLKIGGATLTVQFQAEYQQMHWRNYFSVF